MPAKVPPKKSTAKKAVLPKSSKANAPKRVAAPAKPAPKALKTKPALKPTKVKAPETEKPHLALAVNAIAENIAQLVGPMIAITINKGFDQIIEQLNALGVDALNEIRAQRAAGDNAALDAATTAVTMAREVQREAAVGTVGTPEPEPTVTPELKPEPALSAGLLDVLPPETVASMAPVPMTVTLPPAPALVLEPEPEIESNVFAPPPPLSIL